MARIRKVSLVTKTTFFIITIFYQMVDLAYDADPRVAQFMADDKFVDFIILVY